MGITRYGNYWEYQCKCVILLLPLLYELCRSSLLYLEEHLLLVCFLQLKEKLGMCASVCVLFNCLSSHVCLSHLYVDLCVYVHV